MAAGIAIAVILVGCTLWGLFKGGVKIIWSMGSMLIAIVLATMLNPILTDFFNEQVHLNTYIEKTVEEKLELSLRGDLDKAEADVQNKYIDQLGIPATWKKNLKKGNDSSKWSEIVSGTTGKVVNSFTSYITAKVAQISVNTIAFIMTFLLVFIIMTIISLALGLVDKLPILGQVNKLVGAVAGFVQGLLVIAIIMLIIAFGRNYIWGSALYNLVSNNWLSNFFYNHNLIFWILSSKF